MQRRDFIAGLGAAVARPLAVRAQQGAPIRRIGVLMNGTAVEATSQAELAAFVGGQDHVWHQTDQLCSIDGSTAKMFA
jgi:hypothetical protein